MMDGFPFLLNPDGGCYSALLKITGGNLPLLCVLLPPKSTKFSCFTQCSYC